MSAPGVPPAIDFGAPPAGQRANLLVRQARLITRLEAQAMRLDKKLRTLEERMQAEQKILRIYVQDMTGPAPTPGAPPIEDQP